MLSLTDLLHLHVHICTSARNQLPPWTPKDISACAIGDCKGPITPDPRPTTHDPERFRLRFLDHHLAYPRGGWIVPIRIPVPLTDQIRGLGSSRASHSLSTVRMNNFSSLCIPWQFAILVAILYKFYTFSNQNLRIHSKRERERERERERDQLISLLILSGLSRKRMDWVPTKS